MLGYRKWELMWSSSPSIYPKRQGSLLGDQSTKQLCHRLSSPDLQTSTNSNTIWVRGWGQATTSVGIFLEFTGNQAWEEMTKSLFLWLVWQNSGSRESSPSDRRMVPLGVRYLLPVKSDS